VKNKQYAIGNAEVGREKFMEIKKMVLAQVTAEIDKNGKTDYDIFNMVGKKKGKK
jgi:hypothetical protein